MTLTLRALTLAVAGTLPFAAAAAQQAGSPQDPQSAQKKEQPAAQGTQGRSFQSLDTNRDGQVSQREWNQANPGEDMADQGAAGGVVVLTITPAQRRVMDEQRRESMFRQLDANGNGTLSPSEAGLDVRLMGAFAALDEDENAKIDRQEFNRVHVDDGSSREQQASGGDATQEQAMGGTSQERSSKSSAPEADAPTDATAQLSPQGDDPSSR